MSPDNILLLGLKHSVTAITKADGRILWKTELAGSLSTSFVTVLADEHRAFAYSGGSLYCLDLVNGRILWSNDLPGYGYGIASLGVPGGSAAPHPAAVAKMDLDRQSSS